MRVILILGIVIGALLPHRIGRVAHNHPYRRCLLRQHSRRVLRKHLGKQSVAVLILAQLKGIGEADAVEGGVGWGMGYGV